MHWSKSRLARRETTFGREVLAGITTFLTMAYIIVVNPAILADAGMDFGAVFVATCLAAAIGCLIMGLVADYPIALAPGMGLNAYFTYGVVLGMGYDWRLALGAVYISGVMFLILSLLPVREWIVNAIPSSLKLGISAGIGLFLAIIALKNAGVVVGDKDTLVTLGDPRSWPVILALSGFCLIVALDRHKIPGAVILGILATTGAGIGLGVSEWHGFMSKPPEALATFLQLDIPGAFELGLVTIIFTFLFVDLFDTAGTLVGLAHRAGLLDSRGRLPRLGRALIADSTATAAGALLGTSTTTSYIESAAGINAGGRTGLTAVTVAGLFLLALFFAPLAKSVPGYATAPASLFVTVFMVRGLAEIGWKDVTEYAPAVVAAIAMPLTFSIAHGIGIGFITYVAAKVLSGKFTECPPAVYAIALLFVARYVWL